MSARGQDRGERTKKLFQHELFLSLPSSFIICWSCEDRPKTKEERRIKRFSQIFLVINWLFCILPSQAQQLCRNQAHTSLCLSYSQHGCFHSLQSSSIAQQRIGFTNGTLCLDPPAYRTSICMLQRIFIHHKEVTGRKPVQ